MGLKNNGDSLYKRFLNQYGDGLFCRFKMESVPQRGMKGLYCYTLNNQIVYVGRSKEPFSKRINQGYGTIHPKNCYIDGQATNCHLNSLISEHISDVSLYILPKTSNVEIENLVMVIIRSLQPRWNIALKQ